MILGVGLENVFVPFKKLATNRKQKTNRQRCLYRVAY